MQNMSVDRGWVFKNCANRDALSNDDLAEVFPRLVREAGFTVHEVAGKRFPGEGGSTVSVIIGESSADIHTWPEHGAAHVRLFYCNYSGNNDPKAERFLELVSVYLKPAEINEVPKRHFLI